MQITTSKSSSKKRLIATIIIAAIVLAGIGYFVYSVYAQRQADQQQAETQQQAPVPTINQEEPTTDQIDAGNDAKTDTVTSGDTPTSSDTLTGAVTSSNVTDGTLRIRARLDAVLAGGSCVLNATKAGETTVTRTVAIQALNSTSTCQGFDLPTDEFAAGSWTFTITTTSDDRTATLNGSFTI